MSQPDITYRYRVAARSSHLDFQCVSSAASCRPIVPDDLPALRDAHKELFPIDYEEHFYDCVIHSRDNIFSWAAVCRLFPCPNVFQQLKQASHALNHMQYS